MAYFFMNKLKNYFGKIYCRNWIGGRILSLLPRTLSLNLYEKEIPAQVFFRFFFSYINYKLVSIWQCKLIIAELYVVSGISIFGSIKQTITS